MVGDDRGDAKAGGIHHEPGFLADTRMSGHQGSVGGAVHQPQHAFRDGADHEMQVKIGQVPPPFQYGCVERLACDHEMQRLGQASQRSIDGGDVLVRPPAAHQAHHGFGGGDVEGCPAALALGVGQTAAVVDREGPHHPWQFREGRGALISDGLSRIHRDSPPLASAGEPAEQPHGRVLGGDLLVDEPQVRLAAEEGGGSVQGLARGQDHHRLGAGFQVAGGPQDGRFGQAARHEGDLVRQPPQTARPAARAEDSLPDRREPGREPGGGKQHSCQARSRCGHQPGACLAQGRDRVAGDPVRRDDQAAGPSLGECRQRALMVPAQAVGVGLDEYKGAAGHPATA
ncbi:hypothetical protein [Streptomyces sp. NPDC057579]|uniref:hypothetical protein n=1 Tax=Streptomyces sp. NPDC057579 TaxID=3346172 RepID=UPI0036CD9506